MTRFSLHLIVFAFLLLSIPASRAGSIPVIVRNWLPLQVGEKWTYEGEVRTGDRQRPTVTRWREEETAVAIEAIAEGTLVKRTIRFLSGASLPSGVRLGRHYLCFEKSVGVVAEWIYHNGTYDDQRMRLIRFRAAGK